MLHALEQPPGIDKPSKKPRTRSPPYQTYPDGEAKVLVENSPSSSHIQPHSSADMTSNSATTFQVQKIYGTPRRVRLDHSYGSSSSVDQGTQTTMCLPSKSTTKPPSHVRKLNIDIWDSADKCSIGKSLDQLPSPSIINPNEDLENDSDYSPSDSGSSSSDPENETPEVPICNKFLDQKKYIVFESNLEELLQFCNQCGAVIIEKKRFYRGTMVGYVMHCHNGHDYVWRSQPVEHHLPIGNLLVSGAILATGNSFSKVAELSASIGLLMHSRSAHCKLQRRMFPVIQEAWESEKASVVQQLSGQSIVLGGDARCDSPGHTAKYGTYTFMHASGDQQTATNKIVDLQLVQCTEVPNSNHMEPEGMKRGLKQLLETDKLDIKILATDRHIMVSSIMKKQYPFINHQYDVWHVSKNITKKLSAKSKAKNCEDLSPWIQSVSNHIWWSSAKCNGDAPLLKEMVTSITHHAVNQHSWESGINFHRCSHDKLSPDDRRETDWLKPGSAAVEALNSVIFDKYFLKALPQLSHFCHTGELESYHSMMLKYTPKRQHFPYAGMKARTMLAALDWNSKEREALLDDEGNVKESVVYSKRRKAWVKKIRYKKSEMKHTYPLLLRLLEVHLQKVALPPIYVPESLAVHIGPDKPELEQMSRTVTRFSVATSDSD